MANNTAIQTPSLVNGSPRHPRSYKRALYSKWVSGMRVGWGSSGMVQAVSAVVCFHTRRATVGRRLEFPFLAGPFLSISCCPSLDSTYRPGGNPPPPPRLSMGSSDTAVLRRPIFALLAFAQAWHRSLPKVTAALEQCHTTPHHHSAPGAPFSASQRVWLSNGP